MEICSQVLAWQIRQNLLVENQSKIMLLMNDSDHFSEGFYNFQSWNQAVPMQVLSMITVGTVENKSLKDLKTRDK